MSHHWPQLLIARGGIDVNCCCSRRALVCLCCRPIFSDIFCSSGWCALHFASCNGNVMVAILYTTTTRSYPATGCRGSVARWRGRSAGFVVFGIQYVFFCSFNNYRKRTMATPPCTLRPGRYVLPLPTQCFAYLVPHNHHTHRATAACALCSSVPEPRCSKCAL
jgi:hypothetical protein